MYNSNGPGMFIRDVFRDVRGWMIWSWLFCFRADFLHCHNNLWVYCLPFRWVWLLQGMHVLTNWSTSGKSYFEAGLRDHCLSAHCLGCKGCLVWNIWNPQVWPCVALVLQNHPGSSWTSKSLCQFCLERMHQSPKSPRIVTIVNQSYIIL